VEAMYSNRAISHANSGGVDFVTRAGQRGPHDPPDLRFVVDDQDPARIHFRSAPSRTGNRNWNVVSPGRLVTVSSP
jgi:hypothetical protein